MDLFTSFFGSPLVGLAAITAICAAWAIASVAKQWRKAQIAALETNLKRQMLDKGLSPEEMERVLRASKEDGSEAALYSFTGQEDGDKAVLVRLMTDYGYSGADIESILRAFTVPVQSADPVAARIARARAIHSMVENGKEAEEIGQMLHAFASQETGAAHDGIQAIRS